MRRKEFMKMAAIAGACAKLLTLPRKASAASVTKSPDVLPRRPLGKTGEYLSIIGLGGVVVSQTEQSDANKIVKDAIDASVNYFDVAPTYGNAQERLGPALEPFRKDVFLACKSAKRTAKEITEELNHSLKLLRTDHVDLYQLHGFDSPDDIKTAFGKDGAIEAIEKAKQEGKLRFVGFSTHCSEAALEAMDLYAFDTMLTPLNFVMWFNGDYGPKIVDYARRKGMGVLAIKSMAFTRWKEGEEKTYPKCWYKPITDEAIAALALRFTLSLPITAAVPPGEEKFFRLALKLAPSFIPVSENEKEELRKYAEDVPPLFTFPSDAYNMIKKEG